MERSTLVPKKLFKFDHSSKYFCLFSPSNLFMLQIEQKQILNQVEDHISFVNEQ